jgi:four helix bundle protein
MRDVSKLDVWQRARVLAKKVYQETEHLPTIERFGLQSQMRRAAVSIVANIAEGYGRGGDGDLERHLRIASGSAAELETLFLLSNDVEILEPDQETKNQLTELRKMLNAFVQSVARSRQGPTANG